MGKYYKSPKYGSVFCNDAYVMPVCRLAFPYLVNPKEPLPPRPGEKPAVPSYEITLLLPKESKVHNDFLKGMKEIVDDMLITFNQGRGAKISDLTLVRDGDSPYWQEGEREGKYPYYKGHNLLTARMPSLDPQGRPLKPVIVDANRERLDASKVVGGTLVVAIVSPVIVATGVTYKFKTVQLLKDDGTRYAGGARSDDDYIKMLNSVVPVDNSPQGNGKDEEAPAEVVKAVKTPPLKKVGKSSIADLV